MTRNVFSYLLCFINGGFFGGLLFFLYFFLVGPEGNGPFRHFPWSLLLYPLGFLGIPAYFMGPVSAFLFHGFHKVVSGDIVGFHIIGCLVLLYGFYACLFWHMVTTKKGWLRATLTLLGIHLLLSGFFFGLATVLNLRP